MQKTVLSQKYSHTNLEEWNNKRWWQHVDKCITDIAFILQLRDGTISIANYKKSGMKQKLNRKN